MSKKKIKKLKGNEDLFELFGCEEDEILETEDKVEVNRHGLPVIKSGYGRLRGKSRADLLKEKGVEKKGRKQSLDQKIRNYPAPESELDLHGETALSAEFKADNFIRRSLSKGLLTIRIIVGRGKHSEFGAVLPDTIEDLLFRLKQDKTLLSYRWEKKIKKKSGAIIVYLP